MILTCLLTQPYHEDQTQVLRLNTKCQPGAAQSYLADELSQPADFEARRCLRSTSSPSLIVRCTSLSSCQLSVTELFRSPQFLFGTVCRSMLRLHVLRSLRKSVFRSRLKTHLLRCHFLDCNRHSHCRDWEVTPSLSDTLIVLVTYLLLYKA